MKHTATFSFLVENGKTRFEQVLPAIAILDSGKQKQEIHSYQTQGTKEEILRMMIKNVCAVLTKCDESQAGEIKNKEKQLLALI